MRQEEVTVTYEVDNRDAKLHLTPKTLDKTDPC
jgi:hypothetical protein